jgi:hypothetical protein
LSENKKRLIKTVGEWSESSDDEDVDEGKILARADWQDEKRRRKKKTFFRARTRNSPLISLISYLFTRFRSLR